MKACRTAIAIGVFATVVLSAGCGAVSPSDRGDSSDKLLPPVAYDFNGAKEVPVAGQRVTPTAGSAYIDPWAKASGNLDGPTGPNGPSSASHGNGSVNGPGSGAGNGSGTARVEICHIPPGNPAGQHTIVVAQSAVQAHLAHGDYLGPCVDTGGTADDPDSDADGVTDVNDQCPGTPAGDAVYPNGCTVIVLAAEAGPDISVVEGNAASATASAQVVQGQYNPDDLVYVWTQTAGEQLAFQTNGPSLTVSTTDTPGEFLFLASVSTHDGLASSSDQLAITVIPAQVVHLTAGKWHNVALFEDGDIIPWGTNQDGQLGNGTLVESIEDVDAGATATLLAAHDGVAWTMGSNALSNSPVPLEIAGVTNVVAVAAQYDGGILLDGEGIVWGFGDARNLQCELAGAPHPEASGAVGPIPIPGLASNIVAISAANYHAIVLDADGLAWIWGSRFGCTPRAILNNVSAVAAGDSGFCLMLRSDGTAWGIGYNNFGQLGNGTTVSSFSAVTQVVGLSNVVQVAAGHAHSLFVTGDGNLWATGWNRYCQLGLEDEVSPAQPAFGTTVTRPAQLSLANVRSVAGGYTHSVAVQDDGTVWAWGGNATSQLSGGTTTVLPQLVCTPTVLELPEP